MATYVLIGGAWLGAWVWQDVAHGLRVHGHEVYPLGLTGLGERVHLGGPETNLETHLSDVLNLLRYEELNQTVLVGHSYAGIVVEGVADRAPERLARLVYLDSAPLGDGAAHIDLYPPLVREQMQETVAREGDGWRLPFPGFEALGKRASLEGLSDAARRTMAVKTVAHPFGSYLQPLRLGGARTGDYERVVIACNDFRALLAAGVPQIVALTGTGWRWLELATGHWPMFSAADELASLLHGLAPDE